MAVNQKKVFGLDIDIKNIGETKNHPVGALYQMVEGDPTNDAFLEAMRKQSQEWRDNGGMTSIGLTDDGTDPNSIGYTPMRASAGLDKLG